MGISFSDFARSVNFETAFNVLAIAKRLKAQGKRVIELEIGDSPFPSTASAKSAGIAAIEADQSHYCPSVGLPQLREAASAYVNREHRLKTTAANIIVAPGAKPFEQFFCEAFLNPGDGVLVFSPYFPTYLPNILRRGARPVLVPLRQEHEFRPELDAVERFLKEDTKPKAIFLNTPHNPTGGVATDEDLAGIAKMVRGRDVAVFSDEPYDQMVWRGKHRSILEHDGMLDQCVAAYTFSKSYSMSGWRLGFAVASPDIVEIFSKLLNTTLSCVPPLVQLAGAAALEHDDAERNTTMQKFRRKVELLTAELAKVPSVRCLDPAATFYAFPSVAEICNRLKITSHGLAMYLLEGADDAMGVACLGGECFGEAGGGFIRFSCAEPDDAIVEAVKFFADAVTRNDRVERYLAEHPAYRLKRPY
jgi:aspartate aminotransferase